jgi:hypothetical protein
MIDEEIMCVRTNLSASFSFVLGLHELYIYIHVVYENLLT